MKKANVKKENSGNIKTTVYFTPEANQFLKELCFKTQLTHGELLANAMGLIKKTHLTEWKR